MLLNILNQKTVKELSAFSTSKTNVEILEVFSLVSTIITYYTCNLHIEVNHSVRSSNCSLLYFGRFLAENILSINLKVQFLRWLIGYYGMLIVMNHSDFMYYLKLSPCVQLQNQKIKMLYVSSVMKKVSEDE